MKQRIISFDFGYKRIGVATGNSETNTTQALGTIRAHGGNPHWDEIQTLVHEWRPDQLVVGLPLLLDGSEGEMAATVRVFGQQLATRLGLPVAWVDERLTSSEADYLLRETLDPGKSSGKKVKNNRDGLAAELILRTYLTDNCIPI
jgi:putative Holliday junction resolvase